MLIRLLRSISFHNTTLATGIADRLMRARNVASEVADAIGDRVFAAEQALRFHDDAHRARVARAQQTIHAVIVDLRKQTARAAEKSAAKRQWEVN